MVIQQKPSFGFCSPPEKVNFSLKRDFKKETLNFFSLLRYLGLKFKKYFGNYTTSDHDYQIGPIWR